ncbi:MAG: MFS transporter [Pyrinomonadaceae bacterium]|nr:MFS transporter [Pyrinomonadaceae bacterium]
MKNDRREVFGWLMYDWANSAFYTTVISVLLGPYLTALAQSHVGDNGIVWSFGSLGAVTAKSLFHFCLTISVFLQVLLLPILGAVSDYSNLKKRLMAFFCYLGVTASCLLFFITENYIAGNILLIVANLSFGAANVFYNAYLVDLTTDDKRDKISSYGFAAGYIGGLVMLTVNLVLVQMAESFGMTRGFAVRLSLLLASVWWGVFSLVTFYLVKSRGAIKKKPKKKNYVSIGFSELKHTFGVLLKIRQTALFLVAYFCYNNGIQTVISSASVFLAQELFVARGQQADEVFLLGVFFVAQVSAFVGSLVFERIARKTGTKPALMISLVIWVLIVIYAYAFLDTVFQAWILGVFIGLVLGSSQALSRSLFSQMIPEGKESSFFGLYEISERGTTLVGTATFSVVVAITGSYRSAIFSLVVFLILGAVILAFTDIKKAIEDADIIVENNSGA